MSKIKKPAHPSLPARPNTTLPSFSGFTGFKPRSVAQTPATMSAMPQATIGVAGPYPTSAYGQPAEQYYGQQQGFGQAGQYAASPPQIQNPFPLPGQQPGGYGAGRGLPDPEEQALIAQWSSAYQKEENKTVARSGRGEGPASAGGANAIPVGTRRSTPTESASNSPGTTAAAATKKFTVLRSGGGKTWEDASLAEWDPTHFRLFIGNLAGEVTDESLFKAFSRWPSLQKARVVREKKSSKSKGYGFVSFSNTQDYFDAGKEMAGKYIGSHPVTISSSTSKINLTEKKNPKKSNRYDKKKGKNNKGDKKDVIGGHANTGAKVQKSQPAVKGGMKLLG